MSYSQHSEEEIILQYFNGYVGNLCDIGANNGKTFSNSRALIELGWSAHLVEPSLAFTPLQELYKDNPKVTCHNIAITTETKDIIFYECVDSLLSSVNKEQTQAWGRPIGERVVKGLSVNDFLSSIGYPFFDFITIDAESEDLNILRSLPLGMLGCKLLCIEHGAHEKEISEYCAQYNMHRIHRTFENSIYTL